MNEFLNKDAARNFLLELLKGDEEIIETVRGIFREKKIEIPKEDESQQSAEIFQGAESRPNEEHYTDLVNLEGWRHYEDNFEPVDPNTAVELKSNEDSDARIKELEGELEKVRIELSNLREVHEKSKLELSNTKSDLAKISHEKMSVKIALDEAKTECARWKNEYERCRRECEELKSAKRA